MTKHVVTKTCDIFRIFFSSNHHSVCIYTHDILQMFMANYLLVWLGQYIVLVNCRHAESFFKRRGGGRGVGKTYLPKRGVASPNGRWVGGGGVKFSRRFPSILSGKSGKVKILIYIFFNFNLISTVSIRG